MIPKYIPKEGTVECLRRVTFSNPTNDSEVHSKSGLFLKRYLSLFFD